MRSRPSTGGGDQSQGAHRFGVAERQGQCDVSTHRGPDDVRGQRRPLGQYGMGVVGQLVDRIGPGGLAGPAGAAVVHRETVATD